MIEYSKNWFVWTPGTTKDMGPVHADIELLNWTDVCDARIKRIAENKIRQTEVRVRVDAAVRNLCINEKIQEALKLHVFVSNYFQFPDGTSARCDVVGYVQIKFENRIALCKAVVLPGNSECLLGIHPLLDMDVAIDPERMQLIINPYHPAEDEVSSRYFN